MRVCALCGRRLTPGAPGPQGMPGAWCAGCCEPARGDVDGDDPLPGSRARAHSEVPASPADGQKRTRRLVALLLEVEGAEADAAGRVERRRLLAAQVPRRVQGRLLRLLEAADRPKLPRPPVGAGRFP